LGRFQFEAQSPKLKRGMKNQMMSVFDKIMLRKRDIVDSVMDQLENISQIEPRATAVWGELLDQPSGRSHPLHVAGGEAIFELSVSKSSCSLFSEFAYVEFTFCQANLA
jgi:hypothetical protein